MANDIKIGATQINNIKLGSLQVDRAYKGSELIFGSAPSGVYNVLFDDQFTGTTIDTTIKWRLVNPNVGKITISQNDNLLLKAFDIANTTFGADNLCGLTAWDVSTQTLFMSFDVQMPQQNANVWIFGFTNTPFDLGTTNRFMFYRSNTLGKIGVACIYDGTTTYSLETLSLSLSTIKRLSIKCTSTTITFYYWSGSAWISIGSTSNPYGSMTFKPICNAGDSTTLGGANEIKVSRLYITDDMHTTEIPM